MLYIQKIDEVYGWWVEGACFEVLSISAAVPEAQALAKHDSADGARDGLTIIKGLPTGNHVIGETRLPAGISTMLLISLRT